MSNRRLTIHKMYDDKHLNKCVDMFHCGGLDFSVLIEYGDTDCTELLLLKHVNSVSVSDVFVTFKYFEFKNMPSGHYDYKLRTFSVPLVDVYNVKFIMELVKNVSHVSEYL